MKDYYILYHVVEELKFLRGWVLFECFTQEKNSLYLQFTDGKDISTIQFSAGTGLESLFLRKTFQKARSNFKNLFPKLLGERCLDVYIPENERIVVFVLNSFELWFVLFGGSKTNAFVLDKEKNIVDSFLRPKEYIGRKIQDVIEQKSTQIIETVADYLQKTMHFSKEISKHICHALHLDCKFKLSELSENQKKLLESKCNEIAKVLKNSKTFFVYFLDDKYFITPFEIPELESLNTMASVSQALYFCFTKTLKHNSAQERFKRIVKELKSMLDYLSKEVEGIQKSLDFEQKIKQYEEYAALLLSQPNLHRKGVDYIEITTDNGNKTKIPLKKELTLIQNAEVYYQKIKKLKTNILPLKEKKLNLEEKIKRINSALESLDKIDNYLLVEKFLYEYRDLFPKSNEIKPSQEMPQKFRRYEISPGVVLFVGKNARNNEELTFNFARPNDYWFHTRTTSGSHCVLRISGGKTPTKEIIEKAAQIAAYFSKARNSDYVPVSYTQRKFVRKAKKGEPGSAVLIKEEVIFVEPKKPEVIKLKQNLKNET